MIDIHTHILPGIDDGSANLNQSMDMAKIAYEVGFTDIITTSHYMENIYEADTKDRRYLINNLSDELNKEGINLKLYNGAEIYFTEEFPDMIARGLIPTLAGSKYVLFELPLTDKVVYLDSLLFKLKKMGLVPIIAHPERYQIVKENIDITEEWIDNGALLQCNYGSILGIYGKHAKKTLLTLLKKDRVTFLGTDAHSTHLYANMDKILKLYKKKIGNKKLEELTEINPKKIINNEDI